MTPGTGWGGHTGGLSRAGAGSGVVTRPSVTTVALGGLGLPRCQRWGGSVSRGGQQGLRRATVPVEQDGPLGTHVGDSCGQGPGPLGGGGGCHSLGTPSAGRGRGGWRGQSSAGAKPQRGARSRHKAAAGGAGRNTQNSAGGCGGCGRVRGGAGGHPQTRGDTPEKGALTANPSVCVCVGGVTPPPTPPGGRWGDPDGGRGLVAVTHPEGGPPLPPLPPPEGSLPPLPAPTGGLSRLPAPAGAARARPVPLTWRAGGGQVAGAPQCAGATGSTAREAPPRNGGGAAAS